jgi:hypothetical protein
MSFTQSNCIRRSVGVCRVHHDTETRQRLPDCCHAWVPPVYQSFTPFSCRKSGPASYSRCEFREILSFARSSCRAFLGASTSTASSSAGTRVVSPQHSRQGSVQAPMTFSQPSTARILSPVSMLSPSRPPVAVTQSEPSTAPPSAQQEMYVM